MSIHFKFKSAKEFDTVTFPGAVIRVLDLKKAIVDKKKLAKGLDFDLVITDAQNGKVYDDENTQLPRNTSVTVKRIPSLQPGSGLLARMKQEAAVAAAAAAAAAIHASPPVAPMAGPSPVLPVGVAPTQPMATLTLNTGDSASTEGAQTMEDELAALQSIHEQAEDMRGSRLGNKTWTASNGSNANHVMNYYAANGAGGDAGGRGAGAGGRGFGRGGRGGEFGGRGGVMNGRGGGRTGPGGPGAAGGVLGNPPPNYVCYRCGTPGHYIQNCPTNGDPEYDQHRVKKKTGIPKSFMKAVSDPSEIPVGAGKTVVNAPWGGLAVIEPQNKNFSKLMARSGGSATLDQFISNPPEHLACPLCRRLMSDAVLIPCCQESACDECLRSALIERKLTCPLCNVTNMSPEKLLPNKVLRTSVDEFLRRARTEQQEREQLVKEAEEKALAKQKAAEIAASSAVRRTGESADATLEIKKGKKGDGDEDEEDEFGGDIFGDGEDNEDAPSPQKSSAPPSAAASPPQPLQLPPLPKDDAAVTGEDETDEKASRKTSDASAGGQAADSADKSAPDSGSQQTQPGGNGQGPPGHQMPWGPDGPRGPPMGFGPPGPWFDGPPRGQPGPWFDGPRGPWFDGPFPGPGGPHGPMKGGRGGGRGRGPPPGYFGPGPDYFGPPPGHPDYFGPPLPWFDGPMPPFGGRGGGGDRWFEGSERGGPPRGRDDDRRRNRSSSRDRDRSRGRDRSVGRDGKSERDRRGDDGKPADKESGSSRSRDRERDRSKRSRSRSRNHKPAHAHERSRSRSHSRSNKKVRDHASSSRRSRSTSRSRHHRDHKSSSSREDGKSNKESENNDKKPQEEQKKQESTVKDVKLDQVAAPAIDLDFLAEPMDEDMPSDNETPRAATPVKLDRKKSDESMICKDTKSEGKNTPRSGDDRDQKSNGGARNDNRSSSRRPDGSPSRSSRGRDRDHDRDRDRDRDHDRARNRDRSRGSSDKRGTTSSSRSRRSRSRSRSLSRRPSSRDSSSRRRAESSSKRVEDSSSRVKDRGSGSDRDREKGDRDREKSDRDRERSDRGRDRDRDRDRPREKDRPRDRDKDHERERDRPRDRKERDVKRGRDASDDGANAGSERKRRRSVEKERRGEKGSGGGGGRVVTASGSSRGSRGGRNRRRGDDDKRRIEVEGEGGGSGRKRPPRKKSDDRGGKGGSEPHTKKRSVLDRLGPAL